MKVSVFGSALVAAGVIALGCGCSSGHNSAAGGSSSAPAGSASAPSNNASPAGSGTPASSPANTSSASTTSGGGTGSNASGAPAACATASLRATKTNGNGAAGSFYFQLNFTNVGSSACTLYGYPGVSFTTSGHTQLGQPATRESGTPKLVTLNPGASQSATLRVTDVSVFSQSSCKPTSAALIKIFPPNQRAALYIPGGTQVCTTSQGRAGIWPVGVGMG